MSSGAETSSETGFEALRLRPGAALQLQDPGTGATHGVKFIGALKGKSLLLTLPTVNGQGMKVQTGQSFVIRGFTGKHAYAFESRVLMVQPHPYAYLHLSYPASITAKIVRKALRVRAGLPATVTPRTGGQAIAATIVDLSATGAMIDSSTSPGAVSDVVSLAFPIAFDNITANLNISAVIRSIKKSETDDSMQTGLEFDNIEHNDDLILRCFTYSIDSGEGKA